MWEVLELWKSIHNYFHINWLVEKTGDPDFLSHESLLKWHLEQNNIYINRVHSLGDKNEYGDKHFTAGIIR